MAIAGPTATGKTELALKLARRYRGEIISADSRAIYRGLSIGTAKPGGRWINIARRKIFIYKKIPFHLIDFLSPAKIFSAADFAKKATKAIAEIRSRGRLPILCGGAGFWIEALLDPARLSPVLPDPKLRRSLNELSADSLFSRLKKLDPKRAKTIDRYNKRRLIRAIEITGSSAKSAETQGAPLHLQRSALCLNVLYLGLTLPNPELKIRIRARFLQWLKTGLLAETKRLTKLVSKKRLQEIGLAYPIVAKYLQGKLTKEQMIERATNSIYHYAKRQKTWFRRNNKIRWIKSSPQTQKLVAKFLR